MKNSPVASVAEEQVCKMGFLKGMMGGLPLILLLLLLRDAFAQKMEDDTFIRDSNIAGMCPSRREVARNPRPPTPPPGMPGSATSIPDDRCAFYSFEVASFSLRIVAVI